LTTGCQLVGGTGKESTRKKKKRVEKIFNALQEKKSESENERTFKKKEDQQ